MERENYYTYYSNKWSTETLAECIRFKVHFLYCCGLDAKVKEELLSNLTKASNKFFNEPHWGNWTDLDEAGMKIEEAIADADYKAKAHELVWDIYCFAESYAGKHYDGEGNKL